MYGSVDNSWNDCINDKNLIIKNNKSYVAARDRLLRHKIHLEFRNFASVLRSRSSDQGSSHMPPLFYCSALGSPG